MQKVTLCVNDCGDERRKKLMLVQNKIKYYEHLYILVESLCVLNIWLDLCGWPWSYVDFNL
jgi:hypothetical protein